MASSKKKRKSKTLSWSKKTRNYIIGVVAGMFLVFGGLYALGARTAPKYDVGAHTGLSGFLDNTKAGMTTLRSISDATVDSAKNWRWDKWKDNYDNHQTYNLAKSPEGRRTLEAKQYNDEFTSFTKNRMPVYFDMGSSSGKKGYLPVFGDDSMNLSGIGNDKSLSSNQNKQIKSYITDQYNAWKKKLGHAPGQAEAEYEMMKLMKEGYDKYAKGTKAQKDIDDEFSKMEKEQGKKNDATDKSANKDDGEDLGFSGKIAKALLDIFYSKAVGEWLQKSGPGSTIFSATYDEKDTGPQYYQKMQQSYNSSVYSTIFPEGGDTQSIQNLGQEMGPMFMSLAGVLIVITLILQAGKMGWGQAFSPVRSRAEWYQNIIDTAIAVVGISCYGLLVRMILTVNAGILLGLGGFMAGTSPDGSSHTIMGTALMLGFNQETIDTLTSGQYLGDKFVGIIFSIIYLMTYVGLAVYLKYYYFMREVVFIILWVLGPIFIAFWPSRWGKSRSVNWFRQFCGTVFVQSIHALTLTFMAVLMAWNNSRWAAVKQNITPNTKGEATAKTWGAMGPALMHGNILGAGGLAVKGLGQAYGVVGAGSTVENGWQNFETMVIGFVVMVMFQPLSKALAELFGIDYGMLDSIHQSTSQSLKTTALLTGGAAIGVGAGIAGLGAGAVTAGTSALGGANALKEGAKAAKNASGLKNKLNAFREGAGNAFNANNRLNNLRDRSAKTLARLNGIAGKNVGKLAATAMAQGAGEDLGTTIAMSRLGGEIGDRAASLSAGGLSKLGLKKADPNRAQKEALKNGLNKTTNDAAKNSIQSTIDKAPGIEEQVRKANFDPELANDEGKQSALNEAEKNAAFAKTANLDESAAAEAKAKQLTNGANNFKDAQDVNEATRNAIMANSSLTPEQKQKALEEADKAMVKGGLPTYDPKAIYDKAGYADAQNANDKAIKSAEEDLRADYNAGKIAGAPTPDQMSFDQWKSTSQYQNDYAPKVAAAGKNAAQSALNNSNGHFYGGIDDGAFQKGLLHDNGAVVNSDVFQKEFASGLQSNGISPEIASNLASASDGISGRSLTQAVPSLAGGGEAPRIMDNDLWKQINRQNAKTVNSLWGGQEVVSPSELDSIYTPQGNSYGGMIGKSNIAPTASDFDSYVGAQDKASSFVQAQKNWAQFHNLTSSTSAQSSPFTNLSQDKWEITHPGSDDLNASYGTFGQFDWNGIAQNRITNDPRLVPKSNGLDLSSTFDMLPKVTDPQGNITGVEPGSFRMAVQNTHSMLQAQDGDGNWFNVGNMGRGDGTLGAGQAVYQDLDMSSNGTPTLRFDPSTHSISNPYTYNSNGERVPTTLTNGLPELGSFFNNASFASSTPTNLGDFSHMPDSSVLKRASITNESPTLDQYSNYSDFALQGNNNSYVITGKNQLTGQRETLSLSSKDAPELGSIPANTSYFIPLQNNGETGLDIVPNADGQLFFNGNLRQSDRRLAQRVLDNFLGDDKRVGRVNSYLHDSIMPYTKSYLRNFIANNPGITDGTNIDTFNRKNLDDFYRGLY